MNNKDSDIIHNATLDDDLEIFVFIEMNNFLTIEGFDHLIECDDEGYNNEFIFKYYCMVKRLYNIAFYFKRLNYVVLFNCLNELLNDEYRIDELRYTITHAIRTMGLFRTKIGSNIYNETTCDKIIERLKLII